MKKKISLIFGASGQDGSLMANLLKNKGYKVLAISRAGKKKNFNRLEITKDIKVIKLDIYNKSKVEKIIKNSKCSEIYYFAGQSSLPLSFFKEIETFKSHNLPLFNILYSVAKLQKKIKIFNACSGLIYNHKEKIINESSELNPHSPYGFSKLVSFLMVKYFRENHNLWCCSGLFFNHESFLRPDNYLIPKIVNFLKNTKKKIEFGNINVSKDWGWAPEYMEIVHKILKKKIPKDLIIATGKTAKIKNVLKIAFLKKGLNWKKFVKINKKYLRKKDITVNKIDISQLKKHIGYKPKITINEIIDLMLNAKN
tara:strand:+ start:1480 stop:2412 length:933 start_codon:yes stop_codon:yes gene_type:complete